MPQLSPTLGLLFFLSIFILLFVLILNLSSKPKSLKFF